MDPVLCLENHTECLIDFKICFVVRILLIIIFYVKLILLKNALRRSTAEGSYRAKRVKNLRTGIASEWGD